MTTAQGADVFMVAIRRAVSLLILLPLAACGGGGSNNNNVALQSIAINPASPSQQLGKTLQLAATGTYSDHSTRDLTALATWSSSTTSVATVDATAVVSTVAIGSSTISATFDAVVGRATLMVTAGPATESILYRFGSKTLDGLRPYGSLVQGAGGTFYGTTSQGGAHDVGTVFKVTPDGVETVVYSFASGSDGAYPESSLIQASDGNFYGTTTAAGAHNVGTVFKVTPDGVETVVYSFGASPSDASYPLGSLIQASDGNFYGTTFYGGAHMCGVSLSYGCGTVFKITPAGIETVLYSFGASSLPGTPDIQAADGSGPQGALIEARDGNFYGTTSVGGTNENGYGTVFKLTPAGVETVLYSFGASAADGSAPQGALIEARDGNFYGTTSRGGANSCAGFSNNCGTVFKITPAGMETVLHSFGSSPADGIAPLGSLMQASDGNFYGTTSGGGVHSCLDSNGCGVVFAMTAAGVETILYSFGASASDPNLPSGGLIQAQDGDFYGVTLGAEMPNTGTVFKLVP